MIDLLRQFLGLGEGERVRKANEIEHIKVKSDATIEHAEAVASQVEDRRFKHLRDSYRAAGSRLR